MVKRPDRKIRAFVKKVNRKFKIDKAIFFGSRARGDNFLHSDYDIILVSKNFEGIFFTKRISMVYEFWNDPLKIEPLCYTPEEFKKKEKRNRHSKTSTQRRHRNKIIKN